MWALFDQHQRARYERILFCTNTLMHYSDNTVVGRFHYVLDSDKRSTVFKTHATGVFCLRADAQVFILCAIVTTLFACHQSAGCHKCMRTAAQGSWMYLSYFNQCMYEFLQPPCALAIHFSLTLALPRHALPAPCRLSTDISSSSAAKTLTAGKMTCTSLTPVSARQIRRQEKRLTFLWEWSAVKFGTNLLDLIARIWLAGAESWMTSFCHCVWSTITSCCYMRMWRGCRITQVGVKPEGRRHRSSAGPTILPRCRRCRCVACCFSCWMQV